MSDDDTETVGDNVVIACPWCGKDQWIADDGLWQSSGFDCDACDKPIKLRFEADAATWATRDGVEP